MAPLSPISVSCLKDSRFTPKEVGQFLHRHLPLQFARLHPLTPQGWVDLLIQDPAKWWVWEEKRRMCGVVSIGWVGPKPGTARFSYFAFDNSVNKRIDELLPTLCDSLASQQELEQLLLKVYSPQDLAIGELKQWPVFQSYLHFGGRINDREVKPTLLERSHFLWNITSEEAHHYLSHFNTAAAAMPKSALTSWDYAILPEHIASKNDIGIQRAMLEVLDGKGNLIGFTAMEHSQQSPNKMYQMFTYVDPEHRQKGLAKVIKKTMAAKMAERYPGAWVTAETFAVNQATINLNLSLGLEITAKGKEFLIPIAMLVV